jgi:uncharacterized membrane protein
MAAKKGNNRHGSDVFGRFTKGVTGTFKKSIIQGRSFGEKIADKLSEIAGGLTFLILNVLVFVAWIVINEDLVPGIEAFDPYPFNLLTMAVSLEAIILSTIVLISQRRQDKIDDLRAEIDARIDIMAEEKISKTLELMKLLIKHHEIRIPDKKKLDKMLRPDDSNNLKRKFDEEVKSGEI